LKASAAAAGLVVGSRILPPGTALAHGSHEPVPIPGGTPLLGGSFHVYAPGFDPVDAEPATITDFNGFSGITFVSGSCTRNGTELPYLFNDMRFMTGTFRGADGNFHHGAFAFI
jgi:hypothetical protein